ncbi:unnamed protein product [Parnassius apollo]|uniref:(apollo) hypothetical protein n=1 Tax=Parnassius apollo TaxID=110799 RepID=A0A8S3XGM9_PARAO|nr:unnamed protein product [Parnassius apollo]
METRRTQAGLTRGMASGVGARWRLTAGAWQASASTLSSRRHWRGHSRLAAPSTRLAQGAGYGAAAGTECGRPHHSPSEAGLSATRRRAAGGERARAPGTRL